MRARPRLIEVERRGGGGDPARVEIEPTRMSPDAARAVAVLVDELRPPAPARSAAPADRLTYDVVLHYDNRQERLRYDEAELPDEVRTILDALVHAES